MGIAKRGGQMMLLGLRVYPICLIQIGIMAEEQEGSRGVVTKWCLCQLRVLYAMRIWISQTRAFCLACAGFGSAFSATGEFLRNKEDGRCPGCRKPYEAAAVLPETSVHGGLLFPVSLSLFRGWVFFFFFFFFFFFKSWLGVYNW